MSTPEPLKDTETVADFYTVDTMNDGEEAIFFDHGPLDQWWPCNFRVQRTKYGCDNWFTSAEQWMMFQKALLFQDYDAARKIIALEDPVDIKAVGRTVKGFDADVWARAAPEIVFVGNYGKFGADDVMRKFLLDTGWATLVEASEGDVIWGIGMGKTDDRRLDRTNWRGRNWLGTALMQARAHLSLFP